MTKEQEEFHKYFISGGGLFDPQSLPNEEYRRLFQDIETLFNSIYKFLKQSYPKLPPIQFGFINNLSLNACAAAPGGKYYVGLNIGTVLLLNDTFYKMFASRDVRPEIGNSQSESVEKHFINARRTEGDVLVFDLLHDNSKVNDPFRAGIARFYADTAINFIILHEMCHIIRGHVGYLVNKTGSASWAETELGSAQSSLGDFLWQTLEMDADSFATNHFFLLYERNRNINSPIMQDIKVFYDHWLFAIYVFYRLGGFRPLDYESDRLFKHPPAVLRMSMVVANLMTIFSVNKRDEEGKDVLKNIQDISAQAEKAFCAVTHFEYDSDLFIRNYLAGRNYAAEISGNWDKVRPLIEPFAFGSLPPLVAQ